MGVVKPDDYPSLLKVPQVEAFTDCQISPDGRSIAFSWDKSGNYEIFTITINPLGTPVQITRGRGAKSSPRYSPDGRYLVYVCDVDGSEKFEIWFCDLEQERHINLTPHTSSSLQPNLFWSPDGKKLLFCSDESGIFRTYLLDVVDAVKAPGKVHGRIVMDQGGPHWSAKFSPDGNWISVVAEGKGQDFETYLVSVDGQGLVKENPLCYEGSVLNIPDLAWSPDSKKLLLSSDVSGTYEIGMYDLVGGQISWLQSEKGEKTMPGWSCFGSAVTYILNHGPRTWLVVHSLANAQGKLFEIGNGVHTNPYYLPDGEKIILSYSSPNQPNDLWILDQITGSFQQLTFSFPANQLSLAGVEPESITYPSLDGQPVPALLFTPVGQIEPAPAVIVLHGGPNWGYQFTWMPLFQHLVQRGWVVLAPNYRGSTGYGRGWQQANMMDLGGCDAEDVVAGADALVRLGLADPKRICVTGRSYGGYLTMVCLTRFPTRWAGGSAIAPFLNWMTCHELAREDIKHWDLENMGSPEYNKELWLQRSPYFVLDQVQSPVQLIAGENDIRCPVGESISTRDKLVALGKSVECLVYPDEGHVFIQENNIIDSEMNRVAFLARILA